MKRETKGQEDRDTNGQMDGTNKWEEREKLKERQVNRETRGQEGRETSGHRDKWTERQMDK